MCNFGVLFLDAAKVRFEMLSGVSDVCCAMVRVSQKAKANVEFDACLKVLCQCALSLRKRRFKRVRAVRQYHHKIIQEIRNAHGEAEVFFIIACSVLCHSSWVCQTHVGENDDEHVLCLLFSVCDVGCHFDSKSENCEDNRFIDSVSDYICEYVQEYQQVQAADDLNVNSDSSVCETSDDGTVCIDAGCGNLDDLSETEWNALCSENTDSLNLHDTMQSFEEHQQAVDADMLDVDYDDDMDSVASFFRCASQST